MKKRNKLTAAVLAAAMVGSMAMPALAVTDMTTPDQKSATVKYEVPASYEWSIHSTIDFTSVRGTYIYGDKLSQSMDDENDDASIYVSNCSIPLNKELEIKIYGDEYSANKTDTSFKIKSDQKETVTGSKKGYFKTNDEGKIELSYHVYSGGNGISSWSSVDQKELHPGDVVVTVAPGGSGKNTTGSGEETDYNGMLLQFELETKVEAIDELVDVSSEIAGKYTGTVTYVAEVVDATT